MTKRTLRLLWILLAAACSSGGGGGGGSAGIGVTIATQTLSQGNVGHAYFEQLQAVGGTRPYTWWVSTSGDPLPAGLGLTADGNLAGVPTEAAARTIVIVVQDAASALDLISVPLETRDIEIRSSTSGTLLPGSGATFTASGGVAQYTFALSQNQSGGAITTDGTYVAGASSGIDVVRCTDADGFFDEAAVTVGDDPFAGFQAQWGSTDVWWIDWDVVYDPSPTYASDYDDVLVALGLRRPENTGTQGTEADRLARLLAIRRTLAHLSTYYGNGPDGNPLPGGLSISFVGPFGPSGGTTPSVGGTQAAGPNRYSTICVRYGPSSSVVGTAWLDPGNNRVEHDCGDPSGTSLGVFANRILPNYLGSFNNSIASNPVGPADVPALDALLRGNPPADARQQAIFDVADDFGRVLAAVLAHEIGHSLGLNHSSPSEGPGDIMNASLTVSPSVTYAFNPTHWSQLQLSLPGPNR